MSTRHYCTNQRCGWTGALCETRQSLTTKRGTRMPMCPMCHTVCSPVEPDSGEASANWPYGSCGEYLEAEQ